MITVGIRLNDGTEQEIAEYEQVVPANEKLLEVVQMDNVKYAYLEMDIYDPAIGSVVTDRYAKLYP